MKPKLFQMEIHFYSQLGIRWVGDNSKWFITIGREIQVHFSTQALWKSLGTEEPQYSWAKFQAQLLLGLCQCCPPHSLTDPCTSWLMDSVPWASFDTASSLPRREEVQASHMASRDGPVPGEAPGPHHCVETGLLPQSDKGWNPGSLFNLFKWWGKE